MTAYLHRRIRDARERCAAALASLFPGGDGRADVDELAPERELGGRLIRYTGAATGDVRATGPWCRDEDDAYAAAWEALASVLAKRAEAAPFVYDHRAPLHDRYRHEAAIVAASGPFVVSSLNHDGVGAPWALLDSVKLHHGWSAWGRDMHALAAASIAQVHAARLDGGREVVDALLTHEDIRAISFVGSVPVGQLIQAAAARNTIPVTLELGGKSPQVVFADADLDAALPFLVNAGIQNCGQTCSAASRILVERPLLARFREAFVERVRQLRVGDPRDATSDIGALVSAAHRDKVERYIALAHEEGGRLLTGGERVSLEGRCANGYFLAPTVFDHLDALGRHLGPLAHRAVCDPTRARYRHPRSAGALVQPFLEAGHGDGR